MNESTYAAKEFEYVDISLVSMLRIIRKRWISFLLLLVLCTSASIAYAFLVTPVYKSSTLISPVASGSMNAGSMGRLMQSFGLGVGARATRNSKAVGLAALSSPYFTRAFIDENNLLPILFYDKWDANEGQWLVDDPDDIPTLQEGYELFAGKVLQVNEDDLNGLVEISINWIDPEIAANLANKLVQSVNTRLRTKAIEDADLTIQYLTEELANTTAAELQQSLYYLVESEIEKRTVAKVQIEYSFRVVSPATPSDLDKWESPNRLFIICVGVLVGLFFGMLIAFLYAPTKRVLREAKNS